MRVLIVIGVVGLLLAGGAIVYLLGLFEPGAHTDYALDKQLHQSESPGIIWNAIPVEQAYAAAGRRRTAFPENLARASRDEVDYLTALFALTDAALAERVSLQLQFQAGTPAEPAASNYPAILASLKGLASPDYLVRIEASIYQAIDAQRRYMAQWRAAGPGITLNPDDPLVQESHRHLVEARERLLARYADEPAMVRRALEDHLTALDFL